MKRGLGMVSLGVAVFIFAVITSLVLLNVRTSAPEQSVSTPVSTQIMIAIPGAEPFPAMTEDFLLSSSSWVVVSKSRPLPQPDYVPAGIIVPQNIPRNDEKTPEEQSLRSDIVEPLTMMLTAAKQADHRLFMASGYRSYALQEQYYTNYVRTNGQAEADKFSAKPGNSEHQTGLSLDVSLSSRECYLELCFGQLPAGKWLADNAHRYGFIVRYPADKTGITGYQYEPWHLRYVGTDLAKALHESGKTLDEVVPQLETARTRLIEQKLITE